MLFRQALAGINEMHHVAFHLICELSYSHLDWLQTTVQCSSYYVLKWELSKASRNFSMNSRNFLTLQLRTDQQNPWRILTTLPLHYLYSKYKVIWNSGMSPIRWSCVVWCLHSGKVKIKGSGTYEIPFTPRRDRITREAGSYVEKPVSAPSSVASLESRRQSVKPSKLHTRGFTEVMMGLDMNDMQLLRSEFEKNSNGLSLEQVLIW